MSAEPRYKAESSDEYSFEETEDVVLPDVETEKPETAHRNEPIVDELAEALRNFNFEDEPDMPAHKAARTEESEEVKTPTPTITSLVKNAIPDPGYFEGNRNKFNDWWRGMTLWMKFNQFEEATAKILVSISRLRGDIPGFFAADWTDKIVKSEDTPDWDRFEKALKDAFGLGDEKETAQWRIESFKQGNRHISDFIIEFHVLMNKAKVDKSHAIFLLRKNVKQEIIRNILAFPPSSVPETLDEWITTIESVGRGYETADLRHERIDKPTPTGITYGGTGQPMEIGRKKFEWNDKGEPKCYKCGTFGHMGKNCTKPKNTGVKCYSCGKFGHMAKQCNKKGPRIRSMTEEGEEEGNDEETKPSQGFSEGSE